MKKVILSIITTIGLVFWGCFGTSDMSKEQISVASLPRVSGDFSSYWFGGEAELNHYIYRINRYGAWREGYQILLFVTEDFSKSQQVKLDAPPANIADRLPVLKLNALQRFQTGIYDYSAMQSLFSPLDVRSYPRGLKSTASVQDWCGQTFTQINLSDSLYRLRSFSYFESEGDIDVKTQRPALLEDDLLTHLRIDPNSVPTGRLWLIPNPVYTALRHQPLVPQEATLRLSAASATGERTCEVEYAQSARRILVKLEANFPHRILEIQTFNGTALETEAKLTKSIKSAYWAKNAPQYDGLRAEFGLKPL